MPNRRRRVIEIDDAPTPEPERAADADVQRIDKLAELIRELFCSMVRDFTTSADYGKEKMPNWDGGKDRWGKNHRPVWPRLAKHILRLQADPMAYLKAQFNYATPGRSPAPNTLMSDRAVARYHNYIADAKELLARDLRFDVKSVKTRAKLLEHGLNWDFAKAMRDALQTHGSVYASALARYCMAVEYEFEDLAQVFYDEALIQYLFQKQFYDAAWAGCIPSQLRDHAAALLEKMGITSS